MMRRAAAAPCSARELGARVGLMAVIHTVPTGTLSARATTSVSCAAVVDVVPIALVDAPGEMTIAKLSGTTATPLLGVEVGASGAVGEAVPEPVGDTVPVCDCDAPVEKVDVDEREEEGVTDDVKETVGEPATEKAAAKSRPLIVLGRALALGLATIPKSGVFATIPIEPSFSPILAGMKLSGWQRFPSWRALGDGVADGAVGDGVLLAVALEDMLLVAVRDGVINT